MVGDFILVKKYEYGIRLPISNYKIIDNSKPVHGDVIVFQYPQDKRINYIKRVIALPGDYIEYLNKVVYVNGEKYTQFSTSESLVSAEDLGDSVVVNESNNLIKYNVMKNNDRGQDFSYTVPDKTYFVLGDNRDNSKDSRTSEVGFVPKRNLIGKAQIIFFSHNNSASFYEFWKWHKSIRFSRIGKAIE